MTHITNTFTLIFGMAEASEAAKYWQSVGAVIVVADILWGDSGKGRITDEAVQYADAATRYNGGGNAGHRIVTVNGEFSLHCLPSSILSPDKLSIIAGSVLVNPFNLAKEIKDLEERGQRIDPGSLIISANAHLVMPWHIAREQLDEQARGIKK